MAAGRGLEVVLNGATGFVPAFTFAGHGSICFVDMPSSGIDKAGAEHYCST